MIPIIELHGFVQIFDAYLNICPAHGSSLQRSTPQSCNLRVGHPKQRLHQVRHPQTRTPRNQVTHSSRILIHGQEPSVHLHRTLLIPSTADAPLRRYSVDEIFIVMTPAVRSLAATHFSVCTSVINPSIKLLVPKTFLNSATNLHIVILRNLPALDLRQAEISDGDLQRELRHPHRELRQSGVGAVLDQNRSIR